MSRRRLPNLNALRAFEAAARLESFTRAADELAVTHAAISRHIRGLEAELGLALFHRTGRGVTATEAGRALADGVGAGLDRMAEAVTQLRGEAAAAVLRVSVEPALASRWLIPRLGRFQAAHPKVEVEIDPTPSLARFGVDRVDVALRYGAGGWRDAVVRELLPVRSFPVCTPAVAARLHSPADLANVPLIHDETPKAWGDWLAAAGVGDRVDGDRGARYLDTALAMDAAAAGLGVALGDTVISPPDLHSGRLVRPFAAEVGGLAYHVLWPHGAPETGPIKAFCDWVRAEAAAFLDGGGVNGGPSPLHRVTP